MRKGQEELRPASKSSQGDGPGGGDGEKEGDRGEGGEGEDATSMLKALLLRLRLPNGRGVRAGGRDQRMPSLYVAPVQVGVGC